MSINKNIKEASQTRSSVLVLRGCGLLELPHEVANLDMTSYGQVMQRWGQKIASDPRLAMKFSQMLYQS